MPRLRRISSVFNAFAPVHRLIAETANREAISLEVDVAAHGGVIVVQAAVVCVAAIEPGSTPEAGVVAEVVVAAVAVARRERTEACSVVAARRVAYIASGCTTAPTRIGG